MKIDEVTAAHMRWKQKVAVYLSQPDHTLNPNKVAPDDRCALGCWLRGEARVHAGTFEYEDAVHKHAQFHKAAAELIRKANSGHMLNEEVVLTAYIECEEASGAVLKALANLKRAFYQAKHFPEHGAQDN